VQPVPGHEAGAVRHVSRCIRLWGEGQRTSHCLISSHPGFHVGAALPRPPAGKGGQVLLRKAPQNTDSKRVVGDSALRSQVERVDGCRRAG
jgi:hypothetical protein